MKNLKWIFAIAIMTFAISCTESNTKQTTQATVEEETEPIANITIPSETEVVETPVEVVEVPKTEKPKPKPAPKPKPVENTPTKVEEAPKPAPAPKPTKETTQPIENKNNLPKKQVIERDEPKKDTNTKKTAAPSHAAFNGLLSKYVNSNGAVNYSGFKSNESQLADYLKTLGDNPVEGSWSRDEKLAYWINLYNAATVKLILENYPVNSIQDINGGKPWDKRWIKSGDKMYTLNEIENSVIRPQFNEPLIHFAVNCAAKSCPRLMNKAFTEANVNSLMQENAKWFINNSTYNNISSSKAEISKIFDWYAKDFGNVTAYINKKSNTKIGSGVNVTFMDYDWDLNKQ
jgi:hypothetical protein